MIRDIIDVVERSFIAGVVYTAIGLAYLGMGWLMLVGLAP
jgi:hypothetical protein